MSISLNCLIYFYFMFFFVGMKRKNIRGDGKSAHSKANDIEDISGVLM